METSPRDGSNTSEDREVTKTVARHHVPVLGFTDLVVGDEWESARRTVTETDVVLFAGLTGDFNPLHIDHDCVENGPFGKPVAHGLLGLSPCGRTGQQRPPSGHHGPAGGARMEVSSADRVRRHAPGDLDGRGDGAPISGTSRTRDVAPSAAEPGRSTRSRRSNSNAREDANGPGRRIDAPEMTTPRLAEIHSIPFQTPHYRHTASAPGNQVVGPPFVLILHAGRPAAASTRDAFWRLHPLRFHGIHV